MKLAKVAFEKGYRVSTDGDTVTGIWKRPLRLCRSGGGSGRGDGYLSFSMCHPKARVYVHQLQAYQLYQDACFSDGFEVRHLDGNKCNNAAANIALGTHKQNYQDIPAEQRRARALRNAPKVRKFTMAQATAIRKKFAAGTSKWHLAKILGVSCATIRNIVVGKTYCAVGQ